MPVFPRGGCPVYVGRVPLFRVAGSFSPGTGTLLSEEREPPFSRDGSPVSERRVRHYRATATRLPREGYIYPYS